MPRVQQRKARKDYPKEGIKKGDTYFYAKLKMQRGGIEIRSLKPIPASRLTLSPFKSDWLAAEEDFNASDKTADDMRAAAEALREIGQEAQGSFDNMPEGLQQGDTGQMLEARASTAEEVADQIEMLADEMDALSEPDEDDFSSVVESEDEEEATNEDGLTFDEAMAEYQSEVERIQTEVSDALANMPD